MTYGRDGVSSNVSYLQISSPPLPQKMGLCGSLNERDLSEIEDTVSISDLKNEGVGVSKRPRLILAKCTEDDVSERYEAYDARSFLFRSFFFSDIVHSNFFFFFSIHSFITSHCRYSIPLRTISRGNMSGDIVIVRERKSKKEFALKTIKKRMISEKMLKVLRREVEILASLDHPNVIHCVEIFETEFRISIVLELGDGADLFDRLQKQPERRFKPWIASDIVKSILLALAHCHAHGIVHRDIKLDNFIFDDRNVLKLIDFGLSKQFVTMKNDEKKNNMKIKKMNSVVGTIDTCAPEVLCSDVPYTEKCDMWSVGCVTHAMLCGKYPFFGLNKRKMTKQIKKGNFKMKGMRWKDVPEEAKDFVQQLLQLDPKKRPSALNALKHPWMQHRPPPKKSCLFDSLKAIRDFAELDPIIRLSLAIYVHFSPRSNKLRDAIFLHLDKDRSGRISKQELMEAMKLHDVKYDDLDRIFASVDIDNSNRINFTEFLAACTYSSLTREGRLTKDEINSIFNRLDIDNSQSVSYQNLCKIFGEMFEKGEIVSFFEKKSSSHCSLRIDDEARRITRDEFHSMMQFLSMDYDSEKEK